MHGSFVLVRMKRDEREKRNNWLLIKHRDEALRRRRQGPGREG
jgi:hypothetical protein